MNTGDSHQSIDYKIKNRVGGGAIPTRLLFLRQTGPQRGRKPGVGAFVLFPEAFVLLGEPELQAAVAKHPEAILPFLAFVL